MLGGVFEGSIVVVITGYFSLLLSCGMFIADSCILSLGNNNSGVY